MRLRFLAFGLLSLVCVSAAQAASPSMWTLPSVAALEAKGPACGSGVSNTVQSAYVQGIGIYGWNPNSTATPDPSDTPQTIVPCTGVATGRMVLQNGAIGDAASISALQAIPGPVAGTVINVDGFYAGTNIGGGHFKWYNTCPGTASNVGLYISGSPSAPAGGCWVRQLTTPGFYNTAWWGAYGDYFTNAHDDYAAIQGTINAACAGSSQPEAKVVWLQGAYGDNFLVKTGLNATTDRVTRFCDGLTIAGNGRNGTGIWGATGDAATTGKAVIETTGSQYLVLRGFTIFSTAQFSDPNGSDMGVFAGIESAAIDQETQNQVYAINIKLPHMSGNSGNGSVGFYDFGAEENTFKNVQFTADVSFAGSEALSMPDTGLNYPNSYQTLLATHSLGVLSFNGVTHFTSTAGANSAVLSYGGNSWKFDDLYLGTESGSTTAFAAWTQYGSLSGLQVSSGTVETYPTFITIAGDTYRTNVNLTWGAYSSLSITQKVILNGALGDGLCVDCSFNFKDNQVSNHPLAAAVNNTGQTAFFINSVLSTDETEANLGLSSDIASLAKNLTINAFDGSVTYGNGTNTQVGPLAIQTGTANTGADVYYTGSTGGSGPQITLSGGQNDLSKITYGSITTALQNGTVGSATANLNLNSLIGGTLTDGLSINQFGTQLRQVTFATISSGCTSATAGTAIWVTDSTTATFGATISGGGTNKVLAICDGTNWTVH